jgi:putative inorganic carbon (HCO3(-)) transporter
MQLVVFFLTLGCIYCYRKKYYLSLARYKVVISLWLVFLGISVLQFLPLPAFLVEVLSPQAYNLQSLVGSEDFYLSLDIGQSRISFLKSLAYFLLFLCSLMLIDSERRIRLLLIIMLSAGLIQALYGAFEILFDSKLSLLFNLPVSGSATGSFVYKNHFANFIMLCAAAGIGLIVAELQHEQSASPRDFMRSLMTSLLGSKALIRICLAIMVIALVMSRSRMGNTAFFVSMTAIGLLALLLIQQRTKGLSILIVSMIVIDLFIVSAWFGLDKVQDRLAATSLAQEKRDEVVLDALPMLSDFALVGSGAGSFYSVFPMYKQSEIFAFYDHAHNDYLQTAIELGIPAFLLLAAIVLICFYTSLRAMRQRKPSILKGSAFACSMAILGMLIHMTVDFPIQAPANASYFVVFLALSLIISDIKIRQHKNTESRRQSM